MADLDEIQSGGSMSPGPAMPTPGGSLLNSLGGSLGGSLANSVQSAIGYATRDPQLQQQAIQRENEAAKYRLLMPVGQTLSAAQAKLAGGDLNGANAELQKIGHLSAIFPAIGALQTKLGEQALSLKQRQAQAQILATPDVEPGTPGTPANPGDLEGGATPAEPGTPGKDNRPAKLSTLIGMGMPAKDAIRLVFPDQQHVQMDDGTLATFNPRTGRFTPVINGMGKVMGENIARRGPNGETNLTPLPKIHTVGTSLVQTGVNAEGEPTATTVFQAPPPLQPALMEHMTAQDIAAYRAATERKDYETADRILSQAHNSFFATQVPGDQKDLLQRVGATRNDLASIQRGEDSERNRQLRDAAANRKLQDDAARKALELKASKQLSLETDPASKVFPHYASYADKDGNIVPNAAVMTGAEVARRIKDGELFGLSTEQDNRLRMMANLSPQLDTQKANIPRLFAGVQPGANLGNALSLKTREIGGDAVTRLMDATNFDTSAEQIRILTGSSRGSTRMFEMYMKGGGGTMDKTDTAESALAKNEFAANATVNAKLTTSGQGPLKTLDPYATNPVLRQAQQLRTQGHQVVVSVDRDGNWIVVDKNHGR